jgi:uncharacterized protein YndB with AHSA1/START domain
VAAEPVLILRKTFRASAEFLFDAWIDPALMARWFHARPTWTTEVIAADPRVGGAWELVMHAEDGPACRVFGQYLAIERPRRLVFTWHPDGRADYRTMVTLTFEAIDAHTTELVLTQTGLREEEDRREHEAGWEGCLDNLRLFSEAERERRS